jgi:hypothetical protein
MPQQSDETPQNPDEMDRRLREITAGFGEAAAIKEPSAAERARGQVQPARPQHMSWRNARRAAKLRRPVPEAGRKPIKPRQAKQNRRRSARPGSGATGKPRQDGSPAGSWTAAAPSGDRHRTRSLLTLAAVLALVGGASYGLSRLGSRSPSRDQVPVTSGPVPPLGPAFTVADPFAGSPAERYQDGQAGIVPPAAHPVGGFSAAQVTAAYVVTERMLIAANLDPQTLRGGSPDTFARLLAPQLRSYFIGQLDKIGVDNHGYGRSTRSWVASFAPGSTAFVGDIIKVDGSMEARTAVDSGRHVLRIHFDYLFVYPVQRPGQPQTRMRIVLQQSGDADFAQWNDPGGPLQAWWLPAGAGGAAGARCDVHDGYIHPEFPGSSPDRVHPSGIPVNPYDQKNPPSRAACEAITGT